MMHFRAATVDDVPALSALMQRAFDAHYGEGWHGSQLLGTMALPGTRAELALIGGAAGGFTLTRTVASETELLLIAVDPDRRRNGIGGALLSRAIASAKQSGTVRMYLEVRNENNAAKKLYEKFGFICVGFRKAYYQGTGLERFDATTMACIL